MNHHDSSIFPKTIAGFHPMVALPNRATSGKVLLLMSTLLASGAAAEEAEVFIQAGAACRVRNGGFDHQLLLELNGI